MNAQTIRKALARRDLARKRLDDAHGELQQAVLDAVDEGMSVTAAACLAGVSRQAVHDWLKAR